MRCAACRLIVGAGRAVRGGPEAGSSRAGAASGLEGRRARALGAAPVEHGAVVAALRDVAGHHGVRVAELRMIDYRNALAGGHPGPTLAEVMATFGSWRTARDAAGRP